jgi:hypothetical protein
MKLTPRYRTDYPGEFVVTESRWTHGHKEQTREWVANPIENRHISGRAACIGTDIDHYLFDYTRLQRHRGGLLGSKKLQTYGTSIIAKQMKLDFTVENNQESLNELKEINYQENNIVYTTSRMCIRNPGEFYLIPYSPPISNLALLIYLAAFDGHQEIYMLGYNQEAPAGSSEWVDHVRAVINAYAGTKFILVGVPENQNPRFFDYPNVSSLDIREFISYCDV